MTNLEVAQQFIYNAKAYCRAALERHCWSDVATVLHNLAQIESLLKHPKKENTEYNWDDFK